MVTVFNHLENNGYDIDKTLLIKDILDKED